MVSHKTSIREALNIVQGIVFINVLETDKTSQGQGFRSRILDDLTISGLRLGKFHYLNWQNNSKQFNSAAICICLILAVYFLYELAWKDFLLVPSHQGRWLIQP